MWLTLTEEKIKHSAKKSLFIYFTHAVVRHWQKFEKSRIFRKIRVFLADMFYTQHVAKFPKQRLDKYQIYTIPLLKILLNIAKKEIFWVKYLLNFAKQQKILSVSYEILLVKYKI